MMEGLGYVNGGFERIRMETEMRGKSKSSEIRVEE